MPPVLIILCGGSSPLLCPEPDVVVFSSTIIVTKKLHHLHFHTTRKFALLVDRACAVWLSRDTFNRMSQDQLTWLKLASSPHHVINKNRICSSDSYVKQRCYSHSMVALFQNPLHSNLNQCLSNKLSSWRMVSLMTKNT